MVVSFVGSKVLTYCSLLSAQFLHSEKDIFNLFKIYSYVKRVQFTIVATAK